MRPIERALAGLLALGLATVALAMTPAPEALILKPVDAKVMASVSYAF